MRQRGFVQLFLPVLIVAIMVVLGGYLYTKGVVQFNFSKNEEVTDSQVTPTSTQDIKTSSTLTPTKETSANKEGAFCKNYGTFEVKKTDLFNEYIVEAGESMRDIARKMLNDETKAADFVKVNPQLNNYEIDDPLPIRLKVFVPDDKYNEEGVTSYIKSRGNISFNETKPMFGVNAPNSGTGPFIINDNIKDDLKSIKTGECVEVIYGSKGYDPQKVVFKVTVQQ